MVNVRIEAGACHATTIVESFEISASSEFRLLLRLADAISEQATSQCEPGFEVRLCETDLRVDVFRSGVLDPHNRATWPSVRVTHVPTGCVVTVSRRSEMVARDAALDQLHLKVFNLLDRKHV